MYLYITLPGQLDDILGVINLICIYISRYQGNRVISEVL